jgi:hypothetical protein
MEKRGWNVGETLGGMGSSVNVPHLHSRCLSRVAPGLSQDISAAHICTSGMIFSMVRTDRSPSEKMIRMVQSGVGSGSTPVLLKEAHA